MSFNHFPGDDDDFLTHVFPGGAATAVSFRREILHLNLYCKRYKGAIPAILLTGESGVGKNYTARAISAHSQWLTLRDDERRELYYDQRGKIVLPPSVLIDRVLMKEHLPERGRNSQRVCCLATVLGPQLVDDLAVSELFGHVKGAFTNANDNHPGIFGDDAVDDMLLDEIGDLSIRVQSKLLQFLETRTFRPVGGRAADERTSEHRLFLATNKSLESLVNSGEFREDLYWRIQGYRIHLPPLRDRRDTIRDLAYSVLNSVNQRQRGNQEIGPSLDPISDQYCLIPGKGPSSKHPDKSNWVVQLTADDLDWCQSYDWPGNVRELRQRLDLYVFFNGHLRLSDVMPPERGFSIPSACVGQHETVQGLVARAVQIYLGSVLSGETLAPGQPEKLIGYFEQLVKNAVYRYKKDQRLTRNELGTLFPKAKDPVSTIGRWRPNDEVAHDE